MSAGVVPDTSLDTLLMYAYVQPGVDKVTLEVEDRDPEHPIITYKVRLKSKALVAWKAVKIAQQIKMNIARKTALLALAKMGAPLFAQEEIKRMAEQYLPAKYIVKVEIYDA